MLPQCMPPIPHHFETLRSAPNGGGEGSSGQQGDPGLGGWAGPRFTRLTRGAGSVCMQAYVMSDAGQPVTGMRGWWLYNDGHFYGKQWRGSIWKGQAGTKLQPFGCGWNTTRQVPQFVHGGESIRRVHNCWKIAVQSSKVNFACVLKCCLWCCHYTSPPPASRVTNSDWWGWNSPVMTRAWLLG